MASPWCLVCSTTHDQPGRCPGELIAKTPERHGWRVNVQTERGIEAYGVLVTETNCGAWRARILTYPNILWSVPGGQTTMKFAADSPNAAERKAIEFIRRHCYARGLTMRNEIALWTPDGLSDAEKEFVQPVASTRVIRFLPIRFGVVTPSEIGGTGNLSETGVFVITNYPADINTRLRLMLDTDKQPLSLAGDVRWMNKSPHFGRSPGMGVRLHAPPEQYAKYIRTLG